MDSPASGNLDKSLSVDDTGWFSHDPPLIYTPLQQIQSIVSKQRRTTRHAISNTTSLAKDNGLDYAGASHDSGNQGNDINYPLQGPSFPIVVSIGSGTGLWLVPPRSGCYKGSYPQVDFFTSYVFSFYISYHLLANMKLTAFALAGFLGCAVALPPPGVPGRGPPASSDLPTPVFSSGNPQRPTGVFDKRQMGQPADSPGRGPPASSDLPTPVFSSGNPQRPTDIFVKRDPPADVPGRGPPSPGEVPGRGPPVDGEEPTPSISTPSFVSVTPTPSSTPASSTPVSSSASLF